MAWGATCTLRGCHALPVARLAGLFGFPTPRPELLWTFRLTRSDTFLAAECTLPGAIVSVCNTQHTPNQVRFVFGRNKMLYNVSNTGMAFPHSLLDSLMDFALGEVQLKRPKEIKCILNFTVAIFILLPLFKIKNIHTFSNSRSSNAVYYCIA